MMPIMFFLKEKIKWHSLSCALADKDYGARKWPQIYLNEVVGVFDTFSALPSYKYIKPNVILAVPPF